MTQVKAILVPTDFSATSGAALRFAVDMAQRFGARLYLLHVPGKTGENFEADFPIGPFESAKPALLSDSDVKQVRPEYAVRIGTPAEEIVRYADARDIDMLIMGTHGRSGMAHLLLGSVAEQVVRTAPCPVLLVREQKGAAVQPQPVVADVATQPPVALR